MAQLDINVKATGIEKTTREIKSLDNEINKVSKDSKSTSITISDLSNSIGNLSTRAVAVAGSIAVVGKAFYDLTKQGIQYKSLLEDQLNGLTALRVATTKNIDSMGNALTLSQKYNIAQKESLTTLKELQEVNKRTPQQLLETVELYKILVPTLGKTGASQKELLQVTELLAKASAAYGIQFQQLIAGADGLASGTVEVNSELGRFLKTLGLSNDALKDTNNVSQLVIDKLKPMSGELDTLTVANSNLTNAWNELTGVLAEPIFDSVKDGVKTLTRYLEDATVALSKFFDTFKDAENLGGIEQLNTRMVDVYQKIQDKQKQLDEAFSWNKGKYSAELRALNVELLATAQEYEKFTNSAETATLVIEKQAVKTETTTTKVKAQTKAIQEQRDVLTTSANDWQTYYETIGDYSTAWYFEEAELRSRFIDLSEEQFNELMKVAKDKYFDKFKTETEKLSIDTRNIFSDMTSSLTQTFEDNFFDALMGKFDNFKSFLRSFGSDILSTMFSPLARNMAGGLAGGLAGILGFQNSSLASDLSASGLSLVNGQWVGGGDTNGQPNIIVSSSGEIIKGGSLLSSMPSALNAISALKTGYGIYQAGGIGGYLSGITGIGGGVNVGLLGGLSGSAYGAGYTTLGGLLAGGNTVLTGGTLSGASGSILAGGLATAGLLGGIGGYGVGTLGDKLFGAETKAGTYGAIGGATGAMIGSVIPVAGTLVGGIIGTAIGSLIGGMFGSTKQTDAGLYSAIGISSETLDSIQQYTDFKKKSWFSSKTWTEYKNIDEKTMRALESTFNSVNLMADTLLGVSGQVIELASGKYSKDTLIEKALPKALIQQIMGQASDVVYNLWTDYAKEINKSVLEAMQESVSSFRETIRTFDLYNIKDETANLAKQLEFAQVDYEAIAKAVGIDIATLTVENFNDAYRQAIKGDFTAETIDLWNQLGEALLNVDTLTNSYNESLENLNTTLSTELINNTNSLSEYLVSTFATFASGFENIFSTALTLNQKTQDTLRNLRSNRSNASNLTEFNKLISQFESIKNTTDTSAIQDTYSQLLSMAGNLGSDIRYSGAIERLLTGYQGSFADTENITRVAIVDGLGDLLSLNQEQVTQLKTAVTDGKLTNDELNNISGLTDIQKAGILEVANNSQYFSTESTLSNLEEYAKLQLESLRKTNETQTEKLSAKTLTYGDTIGTQEQIDIAKLLGTSYSNVSDFIGQVQGLDVSQNLSGDISKIISSGGYENLMKLSPYLSSDIVSTAKIEESKLGEINNLQNQINYYNGLLNDALPSYLPKTWSEINQVTDTLWKQVLTDNMNAHYAKFGVDWSGRNGSNTTERERAIALSVMVKQLHDLEVATYMPIIQGLQSQISAVKGYSNGGYTGNGGKYDVAGLVHKGEYVVNQEQLRNIGGVSGLENALRGNNDNLVRVLSSELSQLRADFSTLLKQFKSVTNNGDQMRVKLIS